jgi:hypothetical protein
MTCFGLNTVKISIFKFVSYSRNLKLLLQREEREFRKAVQCWHITPSSEDNLMDVHVTYKIVLLLVSIQH